MLQLRWAQSFVALFALAALPGVAALWVPTPRRSSGGGSGSGISGSGGSSGGIGSHAVSPLLQSAPLAPGAAWVPFEAAAAAASSSSRFSPLALPRARGLRRMPTTTILCAAAAAAAAAAPRRRLPRYPTLVLNGDYTPLSLAPLSTWSWQEAVKAVWADKVTMVAAYDEVVRSPSFEIQVPSVIALKLYVPPSSPSFRRRNVYLRDRYTCQYCGAKGPPSDMSFDHVVPKCQGGASCWDNIVTCCRPCNNRKGNLSLKAVRKSFGMQLQRRPVQPSFHALQAAAKELAADPASRLPRARRLAYNPAWALYLGLPSLPRE